MKLLHIDSSILGDNSASRQLSREVVEAWKAADPSVEVVYRDLAADAIAHFSAATLVAAGTPEDVRDAAQAFEAKLSAETLEEFLAADAVVIGAPMYNFTVPTQLKAWIDRVAVAGKTFSYTEAGPQGLAAGKKVIVASSRGGAYFDKPELAFLEHQESYLKAVFGFFGITDVTFIRAERIGMGPEAKAEALSQAANEIKALAAA